MTVKRNAGACTAGSVELAEKSWQNLEGMCLVNNQEKTYMTLTRTSDTPIKIKVKATKVRNSM